MSYKGIFFDLDGTLVDTLEDLAGAMNFGLEQLGQPGHSVDECRRMIGNGVTKFAERALASDKQDLHAELLGIMRKRYSQKCTDKSSVYGGLLEVVNKLKTAGARLAVVTNKNAEEAKVVTEHYFGVGTFEVITGVEGDKWIKPDPAGTYEIISRMGLEKEECMLVGDSDVDIKTALNAGIKPVGVTWGFRSREQLLEVGAETIIDTPGEILELI